jgi:hypothetical protein
MRADANDLRRFRLLSTLVALWLVGVAATATAQPAREAGAASGHELTVTQTSGWQLPQALPERLQVKNLATPHETTGQVVLATTIPVARPATSSYRSLRPAACCANTVPAWAGRAPPPLL